MAPSTAPSTVQKRPTVCVFLGSSPGISPVHLVAARSLAHALHHHNLNLVYGGGTAGMMGELAKTLVSLSGPASVHGVIPDALLKFERNKTVDEQTFGRTTVVKDMHTRKQMMAREVIEGGAGGGFVALTGGYGTLEELMEIITWNQLGIHAHPIVIYNVEGYWDGILQWVQNAVGAGFITEGNRWIVMEAKTSEEVLEGLRNYRPAEGRFKLQWSER